VTATIEVLQPGLQTTVQDLGRPGLLAAGMAPSGAFDALALQQANLLVGNDVGDWFLVGEDPGAAGLEVLLLGPELRFAEPTIIAVTGADLAPTLDGEPLSLYEAIVAEAGSVLAFAASRSGARAYVAFAGGIDVEPVFGSRATNVRARIGGFGGRKLQTGDTLELGAPTRPPDALTGRSIRDAFRPRLEPDWEIRVVLGPQHELFEPESVETFLSERWRLKPASDRMGCRFDGPPLAFRPRAAALEEQAGGDPSNIVDDTIPVGGIQVPSGLEAIAMGVDGPSLGGYAKIGTVISCDLGRLAQIRPGEHALFRAVTVEEATTARQQYARGRSAEALAEAQ
jgi:antagonist of KipI